MFLYSRKLQKAPEDPNSRLEEGIFGKSIDFPLANYSVVERYFGVLLEMNNMISHFPIDIHVLLAFLRSLSFVYHWRAQISLRSFRRQTFHVRGSGGFANIDVERWM